VQRRILWALQTMDDGRFMKVLSVQGETSKYHPHGDASIGDAIVVLANKRYLLERQGNFGNIYTGNPAAAPRYIECRLTELARTEIFNNELTEFVPTYDGRKDEPVTLPSKLPLTLMLGAEGIAVGLSCRILSHNFIELLQAQIAILKNETFKCLPDFLTGGLMDAREYNDGRGSIKVRARIKTKDENTVVITEIPPTTTTESLIESIEDAVRKGKLKIRNVSDYKGAAGRDRRSNDQGALCLHGLRSLRLEPHHGHQRQSPGRDDGVGSPQGKHRAGRGALQARAGSQRAEASR
jgi:topoisomerase IV subunit A